jgi:hypothetical protein
VDPILAAHVLDLRQVHMIAAALEPEVAVEPLFLRHRAREADADLKDDAGLLRVDVDRTEAAHDLLEPIEQLAYARIFSDEVIVDSIPAAGMPEIRRDEAMPALRALPQVGRR